MTNCPAETTASRPSWNTPFTPLFPSATSTKSSLARAIRDGVRNTRWAQESTRVNVAGPTADCETEPQNASSMSDRQSSPTKVSQTMSCQTASRRSGIVELVSSTTATMDLQEFQESAAANVKEILTITKRVWALILWNCCRYLRREVALNIMLQFTIFAVYGFDASSTAIQEEYYPATPKQ